MQRRGTAVLLVLAAILALEGHTRTLARTGGHLAGGLAFAIRAMGVVLPIAGFFFLGNAEHAATILGHPEGQPAPALLIGLVTAGEHLVPHHPVVLCLGVLAVGMTAGLGGSGFSVLPLTGSLAGALGSDTSLDPATLAALGQIGSVWSGGRSARCVVVPAGGRWCVPNSSCRLGPSMLPAGFRRPGPRGSGHGGPLLSRARMLLA